MTSASMGIVQASLSTNRPIIENAYPEASYRVLQLAKYMDLLMYLPLNFLSLWVIEHKGLRTSVLVGATLMIIGSTTRLLIVYGSFWAVFVGHILSLTAGAFLKNPVTKLSNNWFGESERGIANGISICSGPSGIFVSKILIGTIMWNDDKDPENQMRARSHYEFFIMMNALIITLMIIPAFFLFRDAPPTPPSKIAAKIRIHYSFKESARILSKNKSYLLLFLHFNLVNCVSIFGGEITTFLKPYPKYDLVR